jgi:hypothetical protein
MPSRCEALKQRSVGALKALPGSDGERVVRIAKSRYLNIKRPPICHGVPTTLPISRGLPIAS